MSERTLSRRHALLLAPLAVTVAAGTGFWSMLAGMREGRFDPHDIHAPVVGRRIPAFELPALRPASGFSDSVLAAEQRPVLVNFFASWCIPCVLEAQTLAALQTRLADRLAGALAVWGIAYKDAPDNAAGFVRRTGSPYARVATDRSGTTAIDWGVSGVPESFLVAPGGIITWHLAGALTDEAIRVGLQPALDRLSR